MIKIKDFSKRVGFSVRMLRYLEEVGVLVPQREENNYRVYSEEQIETAIRIKKLQNLGVQLKEIHSLQTNNSQLQIDILEKVLIREQEISEMKSETIPELKHILDILRSGSSELNNVLNNEHPHPKKMRTLGGDEKFHRTAYSIPILKNIYEDHLTFETNIALLSTDFLKFGEWFETTEYLADVFSALNETTFVFGQNLSEEFIQGYEKSWKKFLPAMGLSKMSDFTKLDVGQLMGPHDIVIRSTFRYLDSGLEGEIIIPYAPIYTMAQMSTS